MYSVFTEDITIYSRCAEGGGECWRRMELCGVAWRQVAAARGAAGGAFAEDRATVRIPAGNMPPGWVAPRRALPAGEADCWTVRPGDLVVRGLCAIEVSLGISQVSDAVGECFFVNEVRENLRGAPAGRHILLLGG